MSTLMIVLLVPVLAILGNGLIEVLKSRESISHFRHISMSKAIKDLLH